MNKNNKNDNKISRRVLKLLGLGNVVPPKTPIISRSFKVTGQPLPHPSHPSSPFIAPHIPKVTGQPLPPPSHPSSPVRILRESMERQRQCMERSRQRMSRTSSWRSSNLSRPFRPLK